MTAPRLITPVVRRDPRAPSASGGSGCSGASCTSPGAKKPTKIPYQPGGALASSTDSATWSTFDDVRAAYEAGGFDGVGFVFTADDPFVGIDLDGCRDAATGELAPWAQAAVGPLRDVHRGEPVRDAAST